MTGDPEKICNEAWQNYVNQNYEQSLACLHKLLKMDEKRKHDPRIHHAIATAEFFKSGCAETDKYRQDLHNLTKVDARAKRKSPAPKTSAKSWVSLEFDGHEYGLYNEAVLLYHTRQPLEAIQILIPLLEESEHIEKLLSVRVALLLLSCILSGWSRFTNLHNKAVEVHNWLTTQKDIMSSHDTSSNMYLSVHGSSATTVTDSTQQSGSTYTPLQQQFSMLTAQLQLYTEKGGTALSTLHSSYHESKTLCPNDSPSRAFLTTIYFNNLGVLHMSMGKYHIASLYFSKALENFENNKALYGSSLPEGTTPTSSSSATSGNAAGLGPARVGTAINHILYNNAICLLQREKYELAFRSLVVATPMLHTVPSLWLRLAQCCIRVHEANVLRECSEKIEALHPGSGGGSVIQTTTNSGVTIHHLPTRGTTTSTTFLTNLPSTTTGSEPQQSTTTSSAQNSTSAQMTLTFADKCLRNAHYCLLRQGKQLLAMQGHKNFGISEGSVDNNTNNDASNNNNNNNSANNNSSSDDSIEDTNKDSDDKDPDDESKGNSSGNTNGVSSNSVQDIIEGLCSSDSNYCNMLQSVYVCMAYVALAMNNPSIALHEAKQLLKLKNCSKENKIVCLSYIAEALCWLNRPAEALSILHPVNVQELLKADSTDKHGSENPNKRSAEALFVNLSIVHIMQNKYQRAQECVKQFIQKSSSQHCILLQIYLDLVQGNKDRALELLHKHNFSAPL